MGNFCKYCGEPLPKYKVACTTCLQKKDKIYQMGFGKYGCDKCGRVTPAEENKDEQVIEVGDRVWVRKDGETKIYVGWVYSVKENVFGTSTRKWGNAQESHVRTWWAFDNVDILEIEKQEDE